MALKYSRNGHNSLIVGISSPYVMGQKYFLPQFLPELAGGLLFAFHKKDGGIRPLCVGQYGADAQLGSLTTTRETLLTNISPLRTPILCSAQVALRMGPRDARSCSTCSMICLGRSKTLTIRPLSSTLTSRRPFRKCAAVRLPSTHSRVSLRRP